MQSFLDGTYYHEHSAIFPVSAVCRMFGVSTSGYYNWYGRINEKDAQEAKKKEEDEVKEKIIEVVQKMHYVPGKRTMKLELERDYGIQISVKKCKKYMREMNLYPNKPKKDPYAHQATHDHEYSAPENLLNRQFYIGPRKAILTDITYLGYNRGKCVAYLCVFRDAFTKELLGWKIATRMSVEDLICPAYEMMMKNHGSELKNPDVYVHSDQGSQYLSTTFKNLLSNDEFIQSVSGRGNSWDNSPMESFFGRMKTNIQDIIALAPNFETLCELVDGYLVQYNEKDFQYDLAGLTPVEFYTYITSGVYPCEEYFGVDGSRLLPPNALIEERRKKAEEAAKKARKQAEKRKESGISYAGKDPEKVVLRDIRILEREQKKWEKAKAEAEEKCKLIEAALQKAEAALQFVQNSTLEVKKSLRDRKTWRTYKELDYIYDMRGMF